MYQSIARIHTLLYSHYYGPIVMNLTEGTALKPIKRIPSLDTAKPRSRNGKPLAPMRYFPLSNPALS